MPTGYSSVQVSTITTETFTLGQIVTTTNATPTLAFAISTAEIGYVIDMRFGAGQAGLLSIYGGSLQCIYDRATGGNVTKIGPDIVMESANTPNSTLNITTQANTSNQTIEVYVTGIAATTITWTLEVTIKHRTV